MADVWAFDPGAVATGLARLDLSGTGSWSAKQYESPVEAFLECRPTHLGVVLVEDYSHGGTFTKEAKQTLEIVGFLRYSFEVIGIDVILRHKDKRLSGQAEAAKLMNGTVAELKKHPEYKDAFSALAHCTTFRREYNGA